MYEEEVKKQRLKDEVKIKERGKKVQVDEQQRLELEQQQLRSDFHRTKEEFAIEKIAQGNDALRKDFIKYLTSRKEKGDFLSALSLDNYKTNSLYAKGSKEEFILNIKNGGSFAASMITYLVGIVFKEEFEPIRAEYAEKGNRLNIVLE